MRINHYIIVSDYRKQLILTLVYDGDDPEEVAGRFGGPGLVDNGLDDDGFCWTWREMQDRLEALTSGDLPSS